LSKLRVLVVDDSAFFRRRLTQFLSDDARFEVIGSAVDGREAVRLTRELNPDVITMDIEMPVMDGITAVRKIMAEMPRPILMFSSLTHEGASATLDALEAGAADFLPKKFEDISESREEAVRQLRSRVYLLGLRGARMRVTQRAQPAATKTPATAPTQPSTAARKLPKGHVQLVVIGTSTGGPVALQQVLTKIPANFPAPILLVQHMPATFTPAFAERLNQLCQIEVKEAANGDELIPGRALLAPGGMQMMLDKRTGKTVVKIHESTPDLHYKPSVDIAFASVAKHFPGRALGIVMTGMGADGREGAKLMKQGGSQIWAQDEASCVIYGMPAAVVQAGLADRILALKEIGPEVVRSI
jgi:two-component system chemotaxis response regulator CheB